MSESKFKVDKETAEAEFDRFCEDWEIDNETSNMNEEDREAFDGHKQKLVMAIRRGRFTANDDGSIEVAAGPEKMVKLSIPKGAAYMEMDRYKDREGVHKTYAVLGAMSGQDASFFSSMDGRYLKAFMSVVALFVGS